MKSEKYFTLPMIVAMLKSRRGVQSWASYAKQLEVSRQFMSDVSMGKRGPSKEMLDSIGMERVLVYRRKRSR
jgi:hypothetical protein